MTRLSQITGIHEAVILAGSQTNLAAALGVSKQAVQKWMRQGFAPNGRIEKIRALYGIPAERLCDPRFLKLLRDGDS
jgi:DNA-binding transcriptional regulator YiaG